MNDEYKDILSNLKKEIRLLKEGLNIVSDRVRNFEKEMSESEGGYLPFKFKIMDEYRFEYEKEKHSNYSAHLEIKKSPSKKMRLYLSLENGTKDWYCRPYIELPSELRIEFAPHINIFIKQYSKYISQYLYNK